MKKLAILVVVMSLGGCAATSSLTPCERAILAKMAAEKILHAACPIKGEPENLLPPEEESE